LATSGIDISKFKGHCTTAAAARAADRAGVPTKDIMSAADWSSSNTFAKFYKNNLFRQVMNLLKAFCKVL
jgi:hypothetical protein